MFGKTRVALTFLTAAAALLGGRAASATRPSLRTTAAGAQTSSRAEAQTSSRRPKPSRARDSAPAASPCLRVLAQRAVCASANRRALEVMGADRLKAVAVVQDVRTGALVSFAASEPSEVDVTTQVSPLSLSKLLLAASWWDNGRPDSSFDSTRGRPDAQNPAYRPRVTVHEMLVGGSDSAGRQAALALRGSVGTKVVLEDFRRYGFGRPTASPRDDKFWGSLDAAWAAGLVPAPAYVSLDEETVDAEWADALSLGEAGIKVTALHVSRFLQAVGNGGVMLPPSAREERPAPPAAGSRAPRRGPDDPARVMRESTALRLQSAMLDTVRRGTAEGIAGALKDSGWRIGGKTGSGTALLPKGEQVDGWFAGLVFDPRGRARFTVATFVRGGGYGATHAARISAELARHLIGPKTAPGR